MRCLRDGYGDYRVDASGVTSGTMTLRVGKEGDRSAPADAIQSDAGGRVQNQAKH